MQADRRWVGRASPEQLALVRADLDALSAWTQKEYWQQLNQRLAFLPAQVCSRQLHLPQLTVWVRAGAFTY